MHSERTETDVPIPQLRAARCVLINALTAKAGGFHGFILSLLDTIGQQRTPNRAYILFVPATIRCVHESANVEVCYRTRLSVNRLLRFFWEQFFLPVWAKARGVHLIVSASSFGPRFPLCRHIVWLRNALYFSKEYDELVRDDPRERLRIKLQRLAVRWSLAGADRIIVLQPAMIDRVRAYFDIPVDRFAVVPNACLPAVGVVRDAVVELKQSHPCSFVINAVQFYHRYRNIELVVKAVQCLLQRGYDNWVLLLSVCSDEEPPYSTDFLQWLASLDVSEHVVNFGRLSLAEVHVLYRQSDVAVFPSLCEAFSNAYLIAMECDVPVLAADFDFTRSVFDRGALYFRHDAPDDLANALSRLWQDRELRQQMIAAGRTRRSRYTWAQTYAAFDEVVTQTMKY
jgi:glycosyltransferase involved in cell wall biosynthesis